MAASRDARLKRMRWIPPGSFRMGAEDFYPEEAPVHPVELDGFWIDEHPVTVAAFRRFTNETGYVTSAERAPDPRDYPDADTTLLVPGSLIFRMTAGPVDLRDARNWWAWGPGAFWRRPEGPGSNVGGRELHPVVHIAAEDAEAYASWAGKELPTEAQWEYAARGGLDGAVFTWGDESAPRGRMMANTWQGEFPWQNLEADGYAGTSPVKRFPANGFGLHDMAGNVWEWTSDWYGQHHEDGGCCVPSEPIRARREDSFDQAQLQFRIPRKVIKGGSHLCADTYCLRYRPAARRPLMVDTGMSHVGFRCITRPG
jgi:formylglycine-generating enzyme